MVLIGILAAVGSTMIVDSFTTTRTVNSGNASAGQARYALERLAREIREVKFASSGATGVYCITTKTATNLVFNKMTAASTNRTDCNTEVITVTIITNGSNLTLGYSSPAVTSTLSGQVSSLSLAYLDVDGNPTADNSAIRFVQITLSVTDPTSGQSISQLTRVALRNA